MAQKEQKILPHEKTRYVGAITTADREIGQSYSVFMEQVAPIYERVLRYRPLTPERTQRVLAMRLSSKKYQNEVLSYFTHYYQLDEAGKMIEQTKDFITSRRRKGESSVPGPMSPLVAVTSEAFANRVETDLQRVQKVRERNPLPNLHGVPSPKEIFNMRLVDNHLQEQDKKEIEKVFQNTTDPHMIAYMNFLMSSGIMSQIHGTILDKATYKGSLAEETIRVINGIGKRMQAFLSSYLLEAFLQTQEPTDTPLFPENSALPAALAHYHAGFALGIHPSVYSDLITYNFIPDINDQTKAYLIRKFTQAYEETNANALALTDANGRNPYKLAKQTTREERIAYTASLIELVKEEDPVQTSNQFTTVKQSFDAIKQGLGQEMHTVPVSETDLIDTIAITMDQSGNYINFYIIGEKTLILQTSLRGEAYGFLAEDPDDSYRFFRFVLRKFLSYCQTKNIPLSERSQSPARPTQSESQQVLHTTDVVERFRPQRIIEREEPGNADAEKGVRRDRPETVSFNTPVRRDTSTPVFSFGSNELERALRRLGFHIRSAGGSHKVAWYPGREVQNPRDKNITVDKKREYNKSRRTEFYEQLLRLGFSEEQIRKAFE